MTLCEFKAGRKIQWIEKTNCMSYMEGRINCIIIGVECKKDADTYIHTSLLGFIFSLGHSGENSLFSIFAMCDNSSAASGEKDKDHTYPNEERISIASFNLKNLCSAGKPILTNQMVMGVEEYEKKIIWTAEQLKRMNADIVGVQVRVMAMHGKESSLIGSNHSLPYTHTHTHTHSRTHTHTHTYTHTHTHTHTHTEIFSVSLSPSLSLSVSLSVSLSFFLSLSLSLSFLFSLSLSLSLSFSLLLLSFVSAPSLLFIYFIYSSLPFSLLPYLPIIAVNF